MTADAWLQRMTASKIAAVVGLSPYESRFSLWHRMAGNVQPEPTNDQMRRGHYLEPGVRDWFYDQHEGWKPAAVEPDLWTKLPDGRKHPLWLHKDNPRFGCSPDGWVDPVGAPVALYEGKTAASTEELAAWGEPGTDQIPVGYACQVQWQMHITGVRVTHVAVLKAYLDFAEYAVEYKQDEAEYLAAEATKFLDSLPGGPAEQVPDLDAHSATYDVVRALHPEIDGADIEVDLDLAREFCLAQHDLKAAKTSEQLARNRMADAIGNGQRAVYAGKTIARRQAKAGGTPYVVAAKALPTTFDLKEAS